ncbi:hypothetical protein AA103587_1704 [Gluconobacter kanchanaburiensis NBRC 103587]|nr:hypothetical protein AA103587_1704 [Gluconobacter kanchanaburiensis NBRC 103587]
MPLAFVYAIILVILGLLRLAIPQAHGLFLMLAEISAVCLVVSALIDLLMMRDNRDLRP